MIEYNVWGAFLVGLMGAAHCFGMCGGLIGAFATNLPATSSNRLANQLSFLLSYNLGRILSYTIAGALAGASSAALGYMFDVDSYLIGLRILAGIMMIITGLYIAQIWFGVVHIEKLGKGLWKFLKPLANKLLPIKTQFQATIAGMIWGWLPCGLVYSTLTWSVAAGDALNGAMVMLAFGLGTLPALLSAGLTAKKLAGWVQKKKVRLFSGILIVIFGLQTIYIAIMQLN
ncbi:sulfite exporter TauE/SafE family protein [Shewanella olleyana]|uniref:sulfite exporter TauE/SafE family protein n=1 Tax=Shewanella olleyana TaxID=135626 RepID=UPI00200ED256|nr:sulfite exporter TauE/SafE family protein [Shewanella olleyana]MCL1065686.1 sulfite exporter TauE/SafE family protein [Shewanella olleyana]